MVLVVFFVLVVFGNPGRKPSHKWNRASTPTNPPEENVLSTSTSFCEKFQSETSFRKSLPIVCWLLGYVAVLAVRGPATSEAREPFVPFQGAKRGKQGNEGTEPGGGSIFLIHSCCCCSSFFNSCVTSNSTLGVRATRVEEW